MDQNKKPGQQNPDTHREGWQQGSQGQSPHKSGDEPMRHNPGDGRGKPDMTRERGQGSSERQKASDTAKRGMDDIREQDDLTEGGPDQSER